MSHCTARALLSGRLPKGLPGRNFSNSNLNQFPAQSFPECHPELLFPRGRSTRVRFTHPPDSKRIHRAAVENSPTSNPIILPHEEIPPFSSFCFFHSPAENEARRGTCRSDRQQTFIACNKLASTRSEWRNPCKQITISRTKNFFGRWIISIDSWNRSPFLSSCFVFRFRVDFDLDAATVACIAKATKQNAFCPFPFLAVVEAKCHDPFEKQESIENVSLPFDSWPLSQDPFYTDRR